MRKGHAHAHWWCDDRKSVRPTCSPHVARYNSVYLNEHSSEAALVAAGSTVELTKQVGCGEGCMHTLPPPPCLRYDPSRVQSQSVPCARTPTPPPTHTPSTTPISCASPGCGGPCGPRCRHRAPTRAPCGARRVHGLLRVQQRGGGSQAGGDRVGAGAGAYACACGSLHPSYA